MQKGVSLYIDPSGAQTGGRVVKRELKEIGDSAITTQQRIDQLTRAQETMAKSAQTSTTDRAISNRRRARKGRSRSPTISMVTSAMLVRVSRWKTSSAVRFNRQ